MLRAGDFFHTQDRCIPVECMQSRNILTDIPADLQPGSEFPGSLQLLGYRFQRAALPSPDDHNAFRSLCSSLDMGCKQTILILTLLRLGDTPVFRCNAIQQGILPRETADAEHRNAIMAEEILPIQDNITQHILQHIEPGASSKSQNRADECPLDDSFQGSFQARI